MYLPRRQNALYNSIGALCLDLCEGGPKWMYYYYFCFKNDEYVDVAFCCIRPNPSSPCFK